MRALVRLVVLGVLVAMLAAGCGDGATDRVTTPSTSPSPLPSAVAPAAACLEGEAEHLPDGLGPVVDAFRCGEEVRPVTGAGKWRFEVVRRVTGGLERLLAAYSAADAGPPGEGGCLAVGYFPLVIHLHTPDAVVAVRDPHERCGEPQAEARAAYEALETRVVWERRGEQVESQLSIDSGCAQSWKDMIEQAPELKAGSSPPTPLESPTKVCTYRVTDAGPGRTGDLTATRQLTPDELAVVRRELAASVGGGVCDRTSHSQFVVLHSGPVLTYVALDGCAVQQESSWWRATEGLRAALR